MPASSANLGPGFDVLAAALDLRMELEVEETGRFEVVTDLSIARDRRNLCVRGFTALRAADGARFTIRSEIPLSGGLGTSAAAYVAGLAAADALNGGGADLLSHAARLEGHPDNVAAALLGGFVVCTGAQAERVEPPDGLSAVLVVPDRAVRTAKARAALPAEVPMAEAVFNVGRASLLVLGLARGDLEAVSPRARGPAPPAAPGAALPAVDGSRAPGARVGGAGRDDLGRRAVRARLGASGQAGDVAGRLEREAAGWARVMELGSRRAGLSWSADRRTSTCAG